MNRTTTIVLVAVFAVLAVYVLLVQRPKDLAGAATPTTKPVAYLWPLTADQITGVKLADRVNAREAGLVKDASGAWAITAPQPQPADQAAASAAISGLAALTVDSTLTMTTDLAAFGVLSPTYTVEVSVADGGTRKAVIGDKDPTGSVYYVLREGETNVVTVLASGVQSLIGLLDNPPVVQPTPTVPALESPGTPAETETPVATAGASPGITPSAAATATP